MTCFIDLIRWAWEAAHSFHSSQTWTAARLAKLIAMENKTLSLVLSPVWGLRVTRWARARCRRLKKERPAGCWGKAGMIGWMI
eukprot:11996816-Heterocapsa_arctica.AAC.1